MGASADVCIQDVGEWIMKTANMCKEVYYCISSVWLGPDDFSQFLFLVIYLLQLFYFIFSSP